MVASEVVVDAAVGVVEDVGAAEAEVASPQ